MIIDPEVLYYVELCQRDDPDGFEMCADFYPLEDDRKHAAAEIAYIQTHDKLPTWGYLIEAFEVVDDAYIFIHRERNVN